MADFRETTHFRPATTQSVSFTSSGSTATTNATASMIFTVRLLSTQDAYVDIGASASATTSSMVMLANMPEYFSIRPGEKVAFRGLTASGTAYVTEMTQ